MFTLRLLVVSDSHGAADRLRDILDMHREAERLLFLGDGISDLENVIGRFPRFMTNAVRGNNDRYCDYPNELFFSCGGRNIMCLHGHTMYVKHSLALLEHEGRRREAQLVLYGHTHTQEQHYRSGMYVANPGSVRAGQYALVDILDSGIHISLAKL